MLIYDLCQYRLSKISDAFGIWDIALLSSSYLRDIRNVFVCFKQFCHEIAVAIGKFSLVKIGKIHLGSSER